MASTNPARGGAQRKARAVLPRDTVAVFGTFITLILLGLYAYAVFVGVAVAECLATKGCTEHPIEKFTEGFTLVLTTVGALVSALVTAELGGAEPLKGLPTQRRLQNIFPDAKGLVTAVVVLALVVWVGTGLLAFVAGVMWYPGKLQPLTDMGQVWLGVAVAAAYAYLGVKPTTKPGEG